MEFNQIESFLGVIKHKSFSAAAKELYLAQPTISNNIQRLESELKTTLINRTSKSISLTDSGKLFYKYAVELINIRDKAQFEIMEYENNIQGQIEIMASSIPEQYILPYIIKNFKKSYPKISFIVKQKNSKDIIDDIIRGKETYGVVGAKIPSRKLDYLDFCEDELLLALPNTEKYSLLQEEDIDINFLLSQDFLFRIEGSGTRIFIENCLKESDINIDDLNIVSFLDSNEMIKKMIELDQGISFISEVSIKNEVELGLIKSYRVKDLNLKRKFYFVYSKYLTLPPNVERFKEFIMDMKNED